MSFTNPWIRRLGTIIFHKHEFPLQGCIVYCKLSGAEHSGIYIGGGYIIELNGEGEVVIVTVKEFMGFTPDSPLLPRVGMYTYIACDEEGTLLYNRQVAFRALNRLGERTVYNVLNNNCHMFTASCVTGHYNNNCNRFIKLEFLLSKEYNVKFLPKWRVLDEQSDLTDSQDFREVRDFIVRRYDELITKREKQGENCFKLIKRRAEIEN